MSFTRRQALLSGLFGSGLWGLRSLATGLPIPFLMNPARADTCALDQSKAQFIIMSTSAAGDPSNANMPLTYDFGDIGHAPAAMYPDMGPAMATVGGRSFTMAKAWADLITSADPKIAVGGRIAFIHHSTLNNSHTNQAKVQRLMGVISRQEMLVSYLAKQLAPCLGTVQAAPVMVGATDPGEALTFTGRTLPNLRPTALRDTLLNAAGPLTQLQMMRDQDLNRLNALVKETGNTAQKAYLDRLATSQTEARSISQNLLTNLSMIMNDGTTGQILAATALVAMKVSPVVSIHLPFGGDNHADANLGREATQTAQSVAPLTGAGVAQTTGIPYLMTKLTDLGIRDQTTFMLMNVFGRTLKKLGVTGRDHWGSHHVTVVIGKGVKAGVFGGMVAGGNDYNATPIDSNTGAGGAGGDIPVADSLAAVGKTVGAVVGIPQSTLDTDIEQGKIIKAAVA